MLKLNELNNIIYNVAADERVTMTIDYRFYIIIKICVVLEWPSNYLKRLRNLIFTSATHVRKNCSGMWSS